LIDIKRKFIKFLVYDHYILVIIFYALVDKISLDRFLKVILNINYHGRTSRVTRVLFSLDLFREVQLDQ